MFLLDMLDNLPRLRVSEALMRVFIFIMKECGAADVPSLDRLRKTQKALRQKCGTQIIKCTSAMGNIFYMIDPQAIISKVSL